MDYPIRWRSLPQIITGAIKKIAQLHLLLIRIISSIILSGCTESDNEWTVTLEIKNVAVASELRQELLLL